jgi:hypothetical protein
MQCKRCGGGVMPETVIKLRRSVFGLRETRSQGAYCAACGIGWPADSDAVAAPQPAAVSPRFRTGLAGVWPALRLSGVARHGCPRAGGLAAYDPLPLAR